MVGTDKLRSTIAVKNQLKFTIVDALGEQSNEDELKKLEDQWRNNLHSWAPYGLNTRDD